MNPRLRSAWLKIHLWLGLSLSAMGVLLGISGSLLVFSQPLDIALNPQRYLVSGDESALPLSAYIERAAQALPQGVRPTGVRLPDNAGAPVVVLARADGEGAALYHIYLDPPTGRVLEVSANGGLINVLHNFHEYLSLREYGGRNVVGLIGVALLISSLTGIYLWWPPRNQWRLALTGRRRGVTRSRNLHYVFGFYGSLILAMLSFTGIFLAWPEGGREVVALFAPVTVPPRSGNAPAGAKNGEADAKTEEKPVSTDDAVNAAATLYPAAKTTGIFLPQSRRGAYRVFIKDTSGPVTVFIDAVSGKVMQRAGAPAQTSGDGFLALQRQLHNGNALGLIGRIAICITGLLPLLMSITGILMLLRQGQR